MSVNQIIFHGPLAKYGEVQCMNVASPAEAVRAFVAQLPEFSREFSDNDYAIEVVHNGNSEMVTMDTLHMHVYDATFHFVPTIGGASASQRKGGIKAIIGAVIIVTSFVLFGFSNIGFFFAAMGASLALGGIAMMLAPQPNSGDSKKGFQFSGNSDTNSQDFAVPITYGKDRVKTRLISSQVVSNVYIVGMDQSPLFIDEQLSGRAALYHS